MPESGLTSPGECFRTLPALLPIPSRVTLKSLESILKWMEEAQLCRERIYNC